MLDLLKLDKRTREMLAAALASVEKEEGAVGQFAFETAELAKEVLCLSLQARHGVTIAFTEGDMFIGEVEHDRPLYFTGYVCEVEVPWN